MESAAEDTGGGGSWLRPREPCRLLLRTAALCSLCFRRKLGFGFMTGVNSRRCFPGRWSFMPDFEFAEVLFSLRKRARAPYADESIEVFALFSRMDG